MACAVSVEEHVRRRRDEIRRLGSEGDGVVGRRFGARPLDGLADVNHPSRLVEAHHRRRLKTASCGDDVPAGIEHADVQVATRRQQTRIQVEVGLEVERAGGLRHEAVEVQVGRSEAVLQDVGEDGFVRCVDRAAAAEEGSVGERFVRVVGVRPEVEQPRLVGDAVDRGVGVLQDRLLYALRFS